MTVVDPAGSAEVSDPNAGVTTDGRVVFSWRDKGTGEIYSSIWDPRGGDIDAGDYAGGVPNFATADTILGGAAASDDTMLGAGRDGIRLEGLDGDDR